MFIKVEIRTKLFIGHLFSTVGKSIVVKLVWFMLLVDIYVD